MTEKKEIGESINFVSRHFKEGALLPQSGWKKFRMTHQISYKRNIAAACVAAAVLAASASIFYFSTTTGHSDSKETVAQVNIQEEKSIEVKTAKIEFKNTPLKEVVAEIERVYQVRIENVPQEEILITISYEGTASDVVETINELFNTKLNIATED